MAEVKHDGKRLALAFPQTYVNDSGLSVAALVRRYGIDDLRLFYEGDLRFLGQFV